MSQYRSGSGGKVGPLGRIQGGPPSSPVNRVPQYQIYLARCGLLVHSTLSFRLNSELEIAMNFVVICEISGRVLHLYRADSCWQLATFNSSMDVDGKMLGYFQSVPLGRDVPGLDQSGGIEISSNAFSHSCIYKMSIHYTHSHMRFVSHFHWIVTGSHCLQTLL